MSPLNKREAPLFAFIRRAKILPRLKQRANSCAFATVRRLYSKYLPRQEPLERQRARRTVLVSHAQKRQTRSRPRTRTKKRQKFQFRGLYNCKTAFSILPHARERNLPRMRIVMSANCRKCGVAQKKSCETDFLKKTSTPREIKSGENRQYPPRLLLDARAQQRRQKYQAEPYASHDYERHPQT